MALLQEGFVGVHIGAGQHSVARTQVYLDICAKACRVGVEILRKGGSALEAACAATTVLEDAQETNAGLGSNLTESGSVEMDAGVMEGESCLFGAVGAIPGVKNPILVAKLLVQEQRDGLLPLGRVPPSFLVGEGARDWAVKKGIPSVLQETLISEKALQLYKYYKTKLDQFRLLSKGNPQRIVFLTKKHKLDDQVGDTVGVVVLDNTGQVASTVSSGGIALKQPGRVGQASCYGCGCWAQGLLGSSGKVSVAISTTGCGEHLVRTFLARECAHALGEEATAVTALTKAMTEKFRDSPFLKCVREKLGGAICMRFDAKTGLGDFLWTHTTASMGIAYQKTSDDVATTRMSRLPSSNGGVSHPNGTTIFVEGTPFSLPSRTESHS
nr:LOW QUALITY PROTEIN: threonine aspartase 1-like [Lepeophtheirus salmonis]